MFQEEKEEFINLDWLQEYECMNVSHMLKKDSMKYIRLIILYINSNGCLEKKLSLSSTVPIDDDKINYSDLKHVVSKHKQFGYTIDDILLYNVNIDPKLIQQYLVLDVSCNTKHLDIPSCIYSFQSEQNIDIPPSLPIFHNINALVVLYKENKDLFVLDMKSKVNLSHTRKSVDESVSTSKSVRSKHTKKVRFTIKDEGGI